MAVDTKEYVPLLVSERVEPNAVGRYDLCRAAVLAMLLNGGTNGEWMTNPNGTRWGKAKIAKLLERMRKATGAVSRGSFNQGHVDEFLKGAGWKGSPYETQNVPWKDIVAGLKEGKWGYSLSGDVKHTPQGSPLRKYVNGNVGHNIYLSKLSKDGKRIAFIDPMTPHGTAKYLRWAPVAHFRQFASEFAKAGRVVAGRVKKGYYTSANKVRHNRATVILKLQNDLLDLQKLWTVQQSELIVLDDKLEKRAAKIDALKSEVTLLETELASCRLEEDPDTIATLEDEIAVMRGALDRIRDIALE
jgi:hypothetical protein